MKLSENMAADSALALLWPSAFLGLCILEAGFELTLEKAPGLNSSEDTFRL